LNRLFGIHYLIRSRRSEKSRQSAMIRTSTRVDSHSREKRR
jgi:hypothetical protein